MSNTNQQPGSEQSQGSACDSNRWDISTPAESPVNPWASFVVAPQPQPTGMESCEGSCACSDSSGESEAKQEAPARKARVAKAKKPAAKSKKPAARAKKPAKTARKAPAKAKRAPKPRAKKAAVAEPALADPSLPITPHLPPNESAA